MYGATSRWCGTSCAGKANINYKKYRQTILCRLLPLLAAQIRVLCLNLPNGLYGNVVLTQKHKKPAGHPVFTIVLACKLTQQPTPTGAYLLTRTGRRVTLKSHNNFGNSGVQLPLKKTSSSCRAFMREAVSEKPDE